MIEILNILFLIITSSILLSNFYTLNLISNNQILKKLSLLNIFSINILIVMLALLITSFLNIKNIYILAILFSISLIGLILNKNFFLQRYFVKNYLLFIFLSLVLVFDLAGNPKLEWDGHGWYFHAFNFKENFNFFNLINADRYNQPHLGGIFWGIFWNMSFYDYEFYGRIFYIILYLCAILSVIENVSKDFTNKLLISTILIFLTYDKFLFSGYQEILIFSIIVIICNLMNKMDLKNLKSSQILLLTVFSSLLLWSKNEGIFFFIIIILYIFYFQNLKNKFVLIFLSFSFIFLKFYLLSFNYSFDMSLSGSTFLSDLNFSYEKSLFILTHIIIAMFKYPIWILFIFILYIKKENKENLDIIYFSSISISLIFIIYLFNDTEDYKWLISGSLDRVIFQASGFLIIFVSETLNSVIKRFKY